MEPEVMEAEVETAERQQSTGTGRDTHRTDKSRGRCDDKDNNENMQ